MELLVDASSTFAVMPNLQDSSDHQICREEWYIITRHEVSIVLTSNPLSFWTIKAFLLCYLWKCRITGLPRHKAYPTMFGPHLLLLILSQPTEPTLVPHVRFHSITFGNFRAEKKTCNSPRSHFMARFLIDGIQASPQVMRDKTAGDDFPRSVIIMSFISDDIGNP